MSIVSRMLKAERRIADLYNKIKKLPSGGTPPEESSEIGIYCSALHLVQDRGVVSVTENIEYISPNINIFGGWVGWDEGRTALMINVLDAHVDFIPKFIEVNILNSVTQNLLFQERIYDASSGSTSFYFIFKNTEGDTVIPNTFALSSPLLITIKIY